MVKELHIETTSEKFLDSLHLKNYSPKTIKLYRDAITIFKNHLAKYQKNDLRSVTPDDLKNYRQEILGKPWADETKAVRLSRLIRFFSYLSASGLILQNPAEDIKIARTKRQRKLPQVLSVEEMRELLSLPFDKQLLGLRDRAILELLYSSGLRSGELCALEVVAVDLAGEEVFVACGKGRKDRFVPLGHFAAVAIKRYVELLRPQLEKSPQQKGESPKGESPKGESPKLFLTIRGSPIGASDLAEILRRQVRRTQIQKRVYPHLIRHTMATHLLESGLDITFIQKMLGHKMLETTTLYTHVDKTVLRQLHRKYHPRGNWRFVGSETQWVTDPRV